LHEQLTLLNEAVVKCHGAIWRDKKLALFDTAVRNYILMPRLARSPPIMLSRSSLGLCRPASAWLRSQARITVTPLAILAPYANDDTITGLLDDTLDWGVAGALLWSLYIDL
jgi:hypothetical protein